MQDLRSYTCKNCNKVVEYYQTTFEEPEICGACKLQLATSKTPNRSIEGIGNVKVKGGTPKFHK